MIIAHRLSTIVECDVICFIENGEILEKGTHEELMQLNGKYAELNRLQHGVNTPSTIIIPDQEEIEYV